MKLRDLRNMDMGEAVDWIIDNQDKFELVKSTDVSNLEKDAKRWRALLKSNRIRFIGSGSLGEKGQLLCIEFHADHPDSSEYQAAVDALKKYTDGMMSNSRF